jgi:hypothetical protein
VAVSGKRAANPRDRLKTTRASRQGGRRRFVIEQRGARNFLLLEMKDRVRQWSIGKGLPKTTGERRGISPVEDASTAILDKLGKLKNAKKLTDFGTYELIEGSHDGDFLRVYLFGNRIKGEWTLARDGKRWQLTK